MESKPWRKSEKYTLNINEESEHTPYKIQMNSNTMHLKTEIDEDVSFKGFNK